MLRRSQRLPFAKQTETFGVIPNHTKVTQRKKMSDHCVLQEKQNNQPEMNSNEETAIQQYKGGEY